jgi:integrase
MKEKRQKIRLRDRGLKALKPQAAPYNQMDDQVTAFGVRVRPTGEVIFIMYRRFPGSNKPTRRKIGRYPEMSLKDARIIADEWNAKIRRGIDPAREESAARQANVEAERVRRSNTFEAALQAYLTHKSDLRTIHNREVTMRRELAAWMGRPLASIAERDIKELVNAIKARGAMGQARSTLAVIKGFFSWCVDTGDYGLEVSPAARIKTAAFVGQNREVTRMLADHEIAAYWRAAGTLGYPLAPYFRLLMMTGLRRLEAAEASWPEFDGNGRWVIPAERMKGKPGKTRPHLVPVTPKIAELLESLPRFQGGEFLFSTMAGRKPISSFSKAKDALDAAMRADLEERGHAFEPWTIHDVRRTCRTRFSGCGIPEGLCERLLAHNPPEITRRYNLHAFEQEKRAALESWHRALDNIIGGTGDNVIRLRA